jgi:hypothetical protein
MSLKEFQSRGALLEVRVPWFGVTLWVVPSARDLAALVREGVTRGRIWTAAELTQVMRIHDRAHGVVKTLAHAKLAIDGEIATVLPKSA